MSDALIWPTNTDIQMTMAENREKQVVVVRKNKSRQAKQTFQRNQPAPNQQVMICYVKGPLFI